MLQIFGAAMLFFALSAAGHKREVHGNHIHANNYSVPCGDRTSDIAVLLDASASLGPAQFAVAKIRAAEFVQQFSASPTNRQLVLVFSDSVKEVLSLDFAGTADEKHQLIINAPYLASTTNTAAGINQATSKLESNKRTDSEGSAVPQGMFVITDGGFAHPRILRNSVLKAKNAGIITFAVGVGEHIDRGEFDFIGYDSVFFAKDFESLKDQVESIAQAMCK